MAKEINYSQKHRSEPLFKISKRADIEKWKVALLYIGAIFIALSFGAILLAFLKVNPFEFYLRVFTLGMINNKMPYITISNFINIFTPLLITSIGLSLAFKMKFWNIGGEGQFIIGALVAAAVGIGLGDKLNSFILILLMCLLGGVSAGIYGLITAVLKVKFGTNETLLTLMFNYIALYLLSYFGKQDASWNILFDHESNQPKFEKLPESAQMPTIQIGKFTLNITVIIGLLLVVIIYFYYKKTKQGYEISVVGDSHNTAKYAGMNVPKIILRTVFLSAFIIGLAGVFKVTSSAHVLGDAITGNAGWTGIIIAWLAQLNPFAILLVSFVLSMLRYGIESGAMISSALDSNFADLLQGVILFCILAVDFFIKYKISFNKDRKKKNNQSEAQNNIAEDKIVIDKQETSQQNSNGNITAKEGGEI